MHMLPEDNYGYIGYIDLEKLTTEEYLCRHRYSLDFNVLSITWYSLQDSDNRGIMTKKHNNHKIKLCKGVVFEKGLRDFLSCGFS